MLEEQEEVKQAEMEMEMHRTQLTFCCLHSLQAFLLPPLRFPVIGGMDSMPQGSAEVLDDRSKPAPGREMRGLGLFRRSQLRAGAGGVKFNREAWGWGERPGVKTPGNSSSIRFKQTTDTVGPAVRYFERSKDKKDKTDRQR